MAPLLEHAMRFIALLIFCSLAPLVVLARDINGYQAAVWYTAWHHQHVNLQSINWTLYTTVSYAFLWTDEKAMVTLTPDDPKGDILRDLVTVAHQHNTSVMMTIGGWTGSIWFSQIVRSNDTRQKFINEAITLATEFQVDGIELERQRELPPPAPRVPRDDLPPTTGGHALALSAAVSDAPFLDANGTPLTNVSGFAAALDYISIMNYDVWTVADGVLGPNAPLEDACAPDAEHRHGSAFSAVRAWTAAGFPGSKIMLGVPSYGRSARVQPSEAYAPGGDGHTLAAFPKLGEDAAVQGDVWDQLGGADPCGVPYAYSGIWQFRNLIAADGSPGAPVTLNGTRDGVHFTRDMCSQTPRAYNATSGVMWSYDDLTSIRAKGDFIKTNGLRGSAMWELAGDDEAQNLSKMLALTLNASEL